MEQPDIYTGREFGLAFAKHFGLKPSKIANLRIAADVKDFLSASFDLMLRPDDLVAIGNLMQGDTPLNKAETLDPNRWVLLLECYANTFQAMGAKQWPGTGEIEVKFRSLRPEQRSFEPRIWREIPEGGEVSEAPAGRKVVHVDEPDADDKVRFVWLEYASVEPAQRNFAISTEFRKGIYHYAIPVGHLTPRQLEGAKIETL